MPCCPVCDVLHTLVSCFAGLAAPMNMRPVGYAQLPQLLRAGQRAQAVRFGQQVAWQNERVEAAQPRPDRQPRRPCGAGQPAHCVQVLQRGECFQLHLLVCYQVLQQEAASICVKLGTPTVATRVMADRNAAVVAGGGWADPHLCLGAAAQIGPAAPCRCRHCPLPPGVICEQMRRRRGRQPPRSI